MIIYKSLKQKFHADIWDRRILTRAISALLFLTIAGGLTPSRKALADDTKPNIIFILADDLGYADMGCYGQKNIKTPCLDRMAAEGMRFTQHYAGSTVCAPSRCSLMTGLHTGHTIVRGNTLVKPEGQQPIPDESLTVAEVLKKAGYTTGVTGKWALGGPGTSGEPNNQGFDDWFGYLCQNQAHTYYPDHLWKNREKVILNGNADGKHQQYAHDMFTTYALDFIRKNKSQPFFLYIPYTIPHSQYEVPSNEPYADRPWPEKEKNRAAMVTRMDRDVCRIFDLLKELQIDDNTIVFFSSDNGADFRWEGYFDSCGPLRGAKFTMYEGGLRAPLIVRWPGKIKPSTTSDLISAFWDFLPTCAELAGVHSPEKIDGISMLPTLLGRPAKQKKHEFLYWEFHKPTAKHNAQLALRMGDWKAVKPGRDKPLELYDLKNDIGEKNNVADKNPEIISKIEQDMKSAHTDSPDWPM